MKSQQQKTYGMSKKDDDNQSVSTKNNDKQFQTKDKKLLSPIKSSVLILTRPRAQPAELRCRSNTGKSFLP